MSKWAVAASVAWRRASFEIEIGSMLKHAPCGINKSIEIDPIEKIYRSAEYGVHPSHPCVYPHSRRTTEPMCHTHATDLHLLRPCACICASMCWPVGCGTTCCHNFLVPEYLPQFPCSNGVTTSWKVEAMPKTSQPLSWDPFNYGVHTK